VYAYEITENVQKGIHRLEQLRRRLDAQGPLPRMWAGRTRRDLEAEAVAASTIMEGVAVTVDEARRILVGDRPGGVTEEDASLVDGYRDAMHFVLARADAPSFVWQSELLLAIHHLVLSGSYSAGAGRFRETQNWLTNRGSGEQVYAPPPPADVPRLVDDVMEWMNASTDPGPVTAALVHISVAGIHPFRDGNGRTARIVASLAMYRSGFRSPFFTSLEEWWGRHVDDYYRAFDCLGRQWNATADVTPFIEAHISAQVRQVEALSLRNATERALWIALENVVVGDLGLSERVTHAAYDALFARDVTNGYYRGMADVSAVTASHDLGKLAASGVLQARGAGRSAHYVATPALFERVAREAGIGPEWLAPSEGSPEQRDRILMGLAQRLHVQGDHSGSAM
jgi:Fic family protein